MAKKEVQEKIIIGIDPGTSISGYGIIKCVGKQMQLMTYGVIDLRKKGDEHSDKLKRIFERTLSLIDEFHPDEFAVEAPFFGKNVQSMLKLGRAQGVAMAAALYRQIPIKEYAPKKVKMSITGNGNASKEQVAKMLETLLNFKNEHKTMDATDGLAVAVCHFFQGGNSAGSKGYTGWKSFVTDNPTRVKKKKSD